MVFVTHTAKFDELTTISKQIIGWKIEKQKKIFINAEVRYFDWSEFRVRDFVPFLNALAKLSNDKKFYLYDLDSAPIQEFYSLFGKYPVIELNTGLSEKEYFSAQQEEPGEVPGYTYAVGTTSAYAIFPESMNWHIYGEYDIELARLVSKVGLPKDVPFPHEFIPEDEVKRLIALKK